MVYRLHQSSSPFIVIGPPIICFADRSHLTTAAAFLPCESKSPGLAQAQSPKYHMIAQTRTAGESNACSGSWWDPGQSTSSYPVSSGQEAAVASRSLAASMVRLCIMEALRTAIATAFFVPINTTALLARVTAV